MKKLHVLGALGVLSLVGGLFFHSQYDLSHLGDFIAGGATMWGFFSIGTWAKKKDSEAKMSV